MKEIDFHSLFDCILKDTISFFSGVLHGKFSGAECKV